MSLQTQRESESINVLPRTASSNYPQKAELIEKLPPLQAQTVPAFIAAPSQTRAYVKVGLSVDQVARESLAWSVARMLSLPVPDGYLITRGTEGVNYPIWGTSMVDGGTILHHTQTGLSDTLTYSMLSWPKLAEAAVFDELIQNPDRNMGNVLFTGKRFFLIDHERAFSARPKHNYLARIALTQPEGQVSLMRACEDIQQKITSVRKEEFGRVLNGLPRQIAGRYTDQLLETGNRLSWHIAQRIKQYTDEQNHHSDFCGVNPKTRNPG